MELVEIELPLLYKGEENKNNIKISKEVFLKEINSERFQKLLEKGKLPISLGYILGRHNILKESKEIIGNLKKVDLDNGTCILNINSSTLKNIDIVDFGLGFFYLCNCDFDIDTVKATDIKIMYGALIPLEKSVYNKETKDSPSTKNLGQNQNLKY